MKNSNHLLTKSHPKNRGQAGVARHKKAGIIVAMASVLGLAGMGVQAAVLNSGDVLTIQDGAVDYYGTFVAGSGSFFGMDTNADSKIAITEATAIDGLNGITIGSTQAAGDIDTWSFFGNVGQDYTTVAPTGGTTGGVNLSGWTVFWNSINVPMGTGAWTPANCAAAHMGCSGQSFSNGVANFTWSGTYGDSYTLTYTATVPAGDPSGFGNVRYYLQLVGTVEGGGTPPPVPVPAAAWLLGSGLLGLVGVARRRKFKD